MGGWEDVSHARAWGARRICYKIGLTEKQTSHDRPGTEAEARPAVLASWHGGWLVGRPGTEAQDGLVGRPRKAQIAKYSIMLQASR